ncbi:MAG: hypothetical protein IJQ48_05420 [Prevotella sp.]|nr:hypothetical protein [Prevotella sp.]
MKRFYLIISALLMLSGVKAATEVQVPFTCNSDGDNKATAYGLNATYTMNDNVETGGLPYVMIVKPATQYTKLSLKFGENQTDKVSLLFFEAFGSGASNPSLSVNETDNTVIDIDLSGLSSEQWSSTTEFRLVVKDGQNYVTKGLVSGTWIKSDETTAAFNLTDFQMIKGKVSATSGKVYFHSYGGIFIDISGLTLSDYVGFRIDLNESNSESINNDRGYGISGNTAVAAGSTSQFFYMNTTHTSFNFRFWNDNHPTFDIKGIYFIKKDAESNGTNDAFFPLSEGAITKSGTGTGSYNAATKTLSFPDATFLGWYYNDATPLDFSAYKYMVIEAAENNVESFHVDFNLGGTVKTALDQTFNENLRCAIDLTALDGSLNAVKSVAIFNQWHAGEGKQTVLKRVYLTNNLPIIDKRTTTVGKYGTVCMPQSSIVTGATLYSVTGKNAGNTALYIEEVEGTTLEAGRPYIFKATATNVMFEGEGNTAAAGSDNGLVGVPAETTATADTYVLSNNTWLKCVAGDLPTIGAYRAYLDLSSVSPVSEVKANSIMFNIEDGETTGLNEVLPSGQTINASVVFTMSGLRVKHPTKGLYVTCGKKILIK